MRSESRVVLLIQVDALRGDYATDEDAAFLVHLAEQGLSGMVQPTFGFEPDGAYLAGLYPDQCDGGAHYWYQPESSPFASARHLPQFLDSLPSWPKKVSRRLFSKWVSHTTPYKYVSVADIPLDVLPFMAPAHKHLPWERDYLDEPTIFSLCDERNIPWLAHAAPSHRVSIQAGVERLKSGLGPPIEFAFWHIGDLDKAGHCYGPNSNECRAALRRVDVGICSVFSHLESLYDHISLVVIGDHGMAKVRGTVDVQATLSQRGVRQGQGVLYFLDSTMARFWFFDDQMKSEVVSILRNLDGGKILGREDLDRYHLNYPHNRFGDLLFLADPGILISPNFYQGTQVVKGMHGYATECPEQQSALIVFGREAGRAVRTNKATDMRRVFPTVLRLLDIEVPRSCRVRSILQQHDSKE